MSRVALKIEDVSSSQVNFKMENTVHTKLLDDLRKEFESSSSPLNFITKNGIPIKLPQTFKLFSPLLFDMLETFSATDEISIIVPDFSHITIKELYDFVSRGYISKRPNYSLIKKEPNSNMVDPQYPLELITAGSLFDIKIKLNDIIGDDGGGRLNESETHENRDFEYAEFNDVKVKFEVELKP